MTPSRPCNQNKIDLHFTNDQTEAFIFYKPSVSKYVIDLWLEKTADLSKKVSKKNTKGMKPKKIAPVTVKLIEKKKKIKKLKKKETSQKTKKTALSYRIKDAI